MYLLDTDTLVYLLKGNSAVEKNLQANLHTPITTSVITIMELYYGAFKSQHVSTNLAKVRNIEKVLDIIPIAQEITETFGSLKANLEGQGNRLDDFDLAIAACAMAHNFTLVTNNTKHFTRIDGLKLENWAGM